MAYLAFLTEPSAFDAFFRLNNELSKIPYSFLVDFTRAEPFAGKENPIILKNQAPQGLVFQSVDVSCYDYLEPLGSTEPPSLTV